MPLGNDKNFGMPSLTDAINLIPANPSIIRGLGLFKESYQTTTYVEVEEQRGKLSLVESAPRGVPGQPVASKSRNVRTFSMLHLPKDDVVRADDVQNLRAFGSQSKAEAVAQLVNDKLADMKADIEYTREHLMLGALLGKILDADGTTLRDIYADFALTRPSFAWDLSDANAEIGIDIDTTKTAMNKKRHGESVNGWVALCSAEFMQALTYHPKIKELYTKFTDGVKIYREGDTNVEFIHKGIKYVQYDHAFESGEQIPANEAILLPMGTRKTFREYFAPADMNATVNTKAKPYYASREKLEHDKGWSLHAQSNPLPMVLRPELVATLTIK